MGMFPTLRKIRQGLPVKLAVCIHRKRCKAGETDRDHVMGKLRRKPFPERERINLLRSRIEGDKLRILLPSLQLHGTLRNPRKAGYQELDLLCLQTLPPELEHTVLPPPQRQSAACGQNGSVTGPEQPSIHRMLYIFIRIQFLPVQVTAMLRPL